MKFFKIILPIVIMFLHLLELNAQKHKLQFNDDKVFKIIQVTDTHYDHTNPKSEIVIKMLNEVLAIEKPNLVVFTGDIVGGKNVKASWETITEPLVRLQIPWTFVFGNHDAEKWATKEQIFNIITEIPYCIVKKGDQKIGGLCNHVLPIWDNESKKEAALIYCMDSQEYAQKKGIGKYGWFEFNQIKWYQTQSNKWIRKSACKTLPSLAYFHIPLPEYDTVWENKTIKPVGVKNEKVCAPELNTGMCAAMLLQGDVMGTFTGHDHVNDYIGDYHGLALAYGRFSGGSNTYGNLLCGVRVVVLKQGERRFTTWIREIGGEVVQKVNYPLQNN